jgi:hypothetical protein
MFPLQSSSKAGSKCVEGEFYWALLAKEGVFLGGGDEGGLLGDGGDDGGDLIEGGDDGGDDGGDVGGDYLN